jgi:hypothetical protein
MKQLSLLRVRFPCRQLLSAAMWLPLCGPAAHAAAPAAGQVAKMTVIENKDVSGTVYKKLGLPERKYCWDACLQEERCSGVRWGVIQGDKVAHGSSGPGLCLLMTGPLTLKSPVVPRTEDGKPIHVTSARKEVNAASGT